MRASLSKGGSNFTGGTADKIRFRGEEYNGEEEDFNLHKYRNRGSGLGRCGDFFAYPRIAY